MVFPFCTPRFQRNIVQQCISSQLNQIDFNVLWSASWRNCCLSVKVGWPNFRFCFTFSNLSPAIGACLAKTTKYDESNDKSFRTSEFLVNESVCLKLGITVYLSHDFNIQTFQYPCLFVFWKTLCVGSPYSSPFCICITICIRNCICCCICISCGWTTPCICVVFLFVFFFGKHCALRHLLLLTLLGADILCQPFVSRLITLAASQTGKQYKWKYKYKYKYR